MTNTPERFTVPAGHGLAIRLSTGDEITIVNESGTQVVDTWAFSAEEPAHAMSMEHSRVENSRLSALPGGVYVTDRRIPILAVVTDKSPGIHDTIMAACDAQRYVNLGCTEPHRSCADNLRQAMDAAGFALARVPQPLNLFMNIPIGADFSLTQGAPAGAPGDFVTLRALMDCVVALSSCPQDITPINGGRPTDVPVLVTRAAAG
ncbi:urea carboxylase-associated family protein [Aureimonas altamirensis]|uniref:urea carboxylase-associated family protein n=1 Tax=Aureimonas altamirensis TaxID=370622 RepID=UPI00301AB057